MDPNINSQKKIGNDGTHFTNDGNNNPSSNEQSNETGNITMTTDGKPAWTKDKSTHTWCECNQKGHHAHRCDNEHQNATTNVTDELSPTQSSLRDAMNKTQMLTNFHR
jgi:hypothetical protein